MKTSYLAALATLLLAGAVAHAQTKTDPKATAKPPETAKPAETAKPGSKPAETAKPADKDTAKAADPKKPQRVQYACDGGVTLTVTYPAEAQAKARPVKIVWKEATYFVRPTGEEGKYLNKNIKLELQRKGDEAILQKAGETVADKCKPAK
jgi:hypothetical protein